MKIPLPTHPEPINWRAGLPQRMERRGPRIVIRCLICKCDPPMAHATPVVDGEMENGWQQYQVAITCSSHYCKARAQRLANCAALDQITMAQTVTV